jgi:phosphomevalonate kinase
VLAVDRYAVADGSTSHSPPLPSGGRTSTPAPPEVRAAFGAEPPPDVDVTALKDESGQKLGLGSSAAAVVAALGWQAMSRGEDPRLPLVRTRIFRAARAAHARVQDGGSGVDVAASVHGGALRYATSREGASLRVLELPTDLVLVVHASGTSARTSDLRRLVDRKRARDPKDHVFADLTAMAVQAADAFTTSARAFVAAARAFGDVLEALGHAADAPIVTPATRDLARAAASEGAAFLPSGAGGGDVSVWIGTAPPSQVFVELARARSMRVLPLQVDRGGVRPESPS